MTQEERNQFANKWLSRAIFNHTQIGAFKHGQKEGRAEGIAEGRAEGLAEGEYKKNLENAKGFKEAGTPIAIIAQVTGLSIEEIENL